MGSQSPAWPRPLACSFATMSQPAGGPKKPNGEKEKGEELRSTLRVPSQDEKLDTRVFNIPNILTFSRAGFTPMLGYWILNGQYDIALVGVVAAGFTDWLDGYIARNYNQRSVLGSYIDPIADKFFISVLTVTMAYQDLLSVPLVALIVSRDVGLVAGGLYGRYQQLSKESWRVRITKFFSVNNVKPMNIDPLLSSKINTFAQLGLVGSALTGAALPIPVSIVDPTVAALSVTVAATTIISGWGYLQMARAHMQMTKPK